MLLMKDNLFILLFNNLKQYLYSSQYSIIIFIRLNIFKERIGNIFVKYIRIILDGS